MHRACCSAGEEGHCRGYLPVLQYGESEEQEEPQEDEGGESGPGLRPPAAEPLNGACTPQWMPPTCPQPNRADGDGEDRLGDPGFSPLGEEAPLAAVEAQRRVHVMRAFLRLVGSNVDNEAELGRLLTDISGEELEQIAEERGFAGRCGSPVCSSPVNGYKGKSRFKVERAGGIVQLHNLTCYCSSSCKEYVERWMHRLGNPYDRLKDSPMSKVLHNALASHWNRQGSCEGAAQADCAGALMGSVVEHTQSMGPATSNTYCLQIPAEQATLAVEGYLPKVNLSEQQTSIPRHLKTKQHKVEVGCMTCIPEGTSPCSSTADTELGASGSGQKHRHPQGVKVEKMSAEVSCVSEQLTAALDLQRGCEEIEDFPGVLDLGPEHGGLQDVDKPYLNVDAGPLQLDVNNFGDGIAGDTGTDSDDGCEGMAYFELPPPARQVSTLSIFGRLYLALDSWVTPATIQFLHNSLTSPPGTISAVQDFQALQVLSDHMSRALAPVNRRLGVRIALSTLEKDVARLLATFRFGSPLPCLSAAEWQVIVATVLRGLSLNLLPGLRTAFEGDEASRRITALLRPAGLEESRFNALGFVFSIDRAF